MKYLMLFLVGCASAAVAPVKGMVVSPSQARVELRQVDSDVLKFMVYNDSAETLVVDRDKVYARTHKGDLRRIPGGWASVYDIPAGGSHAVYVRFDWGDTKTAEQSEVRFDKALTIRGNGIAIEAITVVRQ